MLPKISDVISFFESEYADINRQSSWDNSGPQIFTGDREIKRIAISLDPDMNSIQAAIKEGCGLLVTHHPLFFSASKGILAFRNVDKRAITAIRAGLDILSYHTNIDMCEDGTNAYLCSLLGARQERGFIEREGSIPCFKFSVFVPYDYKEKIIEALRDSGAGKYRNYSGCGFMSEGVGMFTPSDNANPFIGEHGIGEIVDEVKIETIVREDRLSAVLNSVLSVHPYEEPAYDIIKLDGGFDYGIGNICSLDTVFTLKNFISLLKEKLNINDIRTNMADTEPFSRFALCTGSGASLWKLCKKKGVHVLLTGDMKYHDALDAYEENFCIIDIGHQASEEIYTDRLAAVLRRKFNVETYVHKRSSQIVSWEGVNKCRRF